MGSAGRDSKTLTGFCRLNGRLELASIEALYLNPILNKAAFIKFEVWHNKPSESFLCAVGFAASGYGGRVVFVVLKPPWLNPF